MNCLSPMSVPRPSGQGATDRVTVPCGVCMACLSKKRMQWAFRLNEELKSSESACFVTLTYDEFHVPYGDNELSLCKRDFQLFMKKLRSRVNEKIRFFAVGEYGSITDRPHYHALFFNIPYDIDLQDLFIQTWTDKKGISLGHCHIGTVTMKSIMYVAKYMITELVSTATKEKSFTLMSRRPGIGISYVEKNANYHYENQIFYGLDHGKKISMPRYYTDKIFTDYEKRKNKINSISISDALPQLSGNEELEQKRQYSERIKNNSKKINKNSL